MKLAALMAGAAVGLLMVVAAPTLFAHNGVNHATEREARQHLAATETQVQGRLNDTQKGICERRAANIGAIMGRSVKRAENFGHFFTTASERVKHFIEAKQQTVNPALLDAIDQAQATLEADLGLLKEQAVFSCGSDNPKEQIADFQAAHRAVLQDLREWRVALKNLIESFKPTTEDAL